MLSLSDTYGRDGCIDDEQALLLLFALRRYCSSFPTLFNDHPTYFKDITSMDEGPGSPEADRREEIDDLNPLSGHIPWRITSRNPNPFNVDIGHPADRRDQEGEEGGSGGDDGGVGLAGGLNDNNGNDTNDNGGESSRPILTRVQPRPANSFPRTFGPTAAQRAAWRETTVIGNDITPAIDALPRPRSRLLYDPRLRRRRPPLDETNSDSDEPPEEDLFVDLDEDEPTFEWTAIEPPEMRRSSGIYGIRNRTEEDLTTIGGSGAAVSLRRGMFNGRRRSVIDRLRELEGVRPVPGIVSRPREPVQPTRIGMAPTNTASQQPRPRVVSSNQENKKTKRQSDSTTERRWKRRKVEIASEDENKPLISPSRPTYLSYTTLPSDTPLPTTFEPPRPSSTVSLTTVHSPLHPPRPCVTFTFESLPGDGTDDDYASSLRADVPIPPECGVYYYEVEVLDAGQKGYMSVGWMKKENKLNRLVGWDKGSYGWHGDDGMSFGGRHSGQPYAEGWTKGDIVGCGINFTTNKAFFTKNGKHMGDVFEGLGKDLFPAVGLRTPKESLLINFTGPFKFDIDKYTMDLRDSMWKRLVLDPKEHVLSPACPPKPTLESILTSRKEKKSVQSLEETNCEEPYIIGGPDSGDLDIPKISAYHDIKERVPAAFVLDYLRHEGYTKTLGLVKNDMAKLKRINRSRPVVDPVEKEFNEDSTLTDFPSKEDCLVWLKQRIIHNDSATLPWKVIDQVLEDRDQRMIKIHYFIHLLRLSHRDEDSIGKEEGGEGSEDQAINYARELKQQSSFWSENEKAALTEAVALLGSTPDEWDVNGISGVARRANDAEVAIKAARVKLGMKPESYLSTAFSQLTQTLRFMAPEEPMAGFVDPSRLLSDPQSFHGISKNHSIKSIMRQRKEKEKAEEAIAAAEEEKEKEREEKDKDKDKEEEKDREAGGMQA